jgi:hypothetical protein
VAIKKKGTDLATVVNKSSSTAPLYDEACRALAKAVSVDETKKIRDTAAALAACAKIAKNTKLASDATKLRLRAERHMGKLLREMAKRGERHEGKGRKKRSQPATVKLKDLGINKTQLDARRAADGTVG